MLDVSKEKNGGAVRSMSSEMNPLFSPAFWRQKYLRMSRRTRDAVTGGTSLAVANCIGILLGVFITGILARYLTAKEFGLWALVMSLTGAVGGTDFGFGNALRNKLAQLYARNEVGENEAQQYFGAVFNLFLAVSFTLTMIGLVGMSKFPWTLILKSSDAKILGEGALLFALGVSFFSLSQTFGIGHMGFFSYQESHWNAFAGIASKILLLCMIYFGVRLHAGIVPLYTIYLSCMLFTSVLTFMVFLHKRRWRMSFVPLGITIEKSRELIGESVEFVLLQTASTIYVQLDLFIISGTLGLEAVGGYVLVKKLYMLFGSLQFSFLMPIWSAYTEAMESKDFFWVRGILSKTAVMSLGFFLLALPVVSIFGSRIIYLWTGKVVPDPIFYVLLGSAFLLQAWANSFSVFLNAVRKLRVQIALLVVSGALILMCAPFMGNRFGIRGICVVLVLSALPMAISNPILSLSFVSEAEGAENLPIAAQVPNL